jgi:hypothetical protein
MFETNLFLREMKCLGSCSSTMKFEQDKKSADKYVCRCYVKVCTLYQHRRSVRDLFFFKTIWKRFKNNHSGLNSLCFTTAKKLYRIH